MLSARNHDEEPFQIACGSGHMEIAAIEADAAGPTSPP